uniref:polynucleotide adenylyltransferase n=1 Tax=Panagrellus redivivus TaxID=6233 RepID=A0A7E4W371_PANRE
MTPQALGFRTSSAMILNTVPTPESPSEDHSSLIRVKQSPHNHRRAAQSQSRGAMTMTSSNPTSGAPRSGAVKPECSTSYGAVPSSTAHVMELNNKQIDRLRSVLSQSVEIHGRDNFPTLEIVLSALISRVRRYLINAGLHLKAVKLNGGAASYCLANDAFQYSDLDLIFPISLATEEDFDKVRQAVFAAILSLMPELANSICADTLKEVYVSKMVKVCNEEDRWSLFSLHNDFGKCIELKFVDRMARQFEFSVDSFQITLDPLLDAEGLNHPVHRPVVVAESVFGDIRQALMHLQRRLIDTRNPEEIRGGGLLKYCGLLTRKYAATPNCREMEKYMCSRFFIDFSDIQTQEMKLRAYLDNHFGCEDELKLDYLQILHKTIKESTICLMGHERRQTLQMVDRLRQQLEYGLMCSSLSVSTTPESSAASGMSSPAPPSSTASTAGEIGTFASSPGRSTLLYLPPNSNFWIPVV